MVSQMEFDAEQLVGRFPDSFFFGSATASYQIEGAANKDGRGRSIWDTFSKTPGKVVNGDNGDKACDHYHLWESDLDLMVEMGLRAYRLSIAWPRIQAMGKGAINNAGVEFYDRLLDGCLERGIAPHITLYHWDLPQSLEDQGGWRGRDTVMRFADYAEIIARNYADRVASIATLNEPWCIAHHSHLNGVHAPGLTDIEATMRVVHHLNLAHGLGAQALRSVAPNIPVGVVLNTQSILPYSDREADIEAAERAFQFNNGLFCQPLLEGSYPDAVIEHLEDYLPDDYATDLSDIHQPMEWLGINYYTPEYIVDAPKGAGPHKGFPYAQGKHRGDLPKTDIGWEIEAAAFTHLLKDLNERYTLPPIIISENGCCDNTEAEDGVVKDTMRRKYLEDHIHAVADAMEAGVDIRGYLAWSFMDNFEWAEGYTMRFGLVHVDYSEQTRTIKESGRWYSAVCQASA